MKWYGAERNLSSGKYTELAIWWGFWVSRREVGRAPGRTGEEPNTQGYTRQRCCLWWGARNSDEPLAAVCGRSANLLGGQTAFRQEQTPENPQIIEDTAARGHVKIQFGKIIGDQEEGLFAAGCAFTVGKYDFGLGVAPGLFERFGKQGYVFVGTLDIVKGRLGLMAHKTRLSSFPADRPEKQNRYI